MAYYYSVSPTADVATSATANTEVDHLRMASVAAAMVGVTAMYVGGKGAALTSVTGIELRLKRMNPASTVGTAITPSPRDVRALVAASSTWFTAPTIGTAAALQLAIVCSSAGPGYWLAGDPDNAIIANAGGGAANGNFDLLSLTQGTVALNLHYTIEFYER